MVVEPPPVSGCKVLEMSHLRCDQCRRLFILNGLRLNYLFSASWTEDARPQVFLLSSVGVLPKSPAREDILQTTEVEKVMNALARDGIDSG